MFLNLCARNQGQRPHTIFIIQYYSVKMGYMCVIFQLQLTGHVYLEGWAEDSEVESKFAGRDCRDQLVMSVVDRL